MKINWSAKYQSKFEHLCAGDCFTIPNSSYVYMKVYAYAQLEQNYLTINLSDGDIANFNDGDNVIPVQCELTVK